MAGRRCSSAGRTRAPPPAGVEERRGGQQGRAVRQELTSQQHALSPPLPPTPLPPPARSHGTCMTMRTMPSTPCARRLRRSTAATGGSGSKACTRCTEGASDGSSSRRRLNRPMLAPVGWGDSAGGKAGCLASGGAGRPRKQQGRTRGSLRTPPGQPAPPPPAQHAVLSPTSSTTLPGGRARPLSLAR